MTGSINKVILIGNVGQTPEVRHGSSAGDDASGSFKVARISLATSERWKDAKTQEMRDRTQWHRLVAYQPKLVDLIGSYVNKGSKIYIEGQLQTRKWTDAQGQERWTTEIIVGRLIFLDNKNRGSDGAPSSPEDESPAPRSSAASQDKDVDVEFDDDIPF